MIPSTLSGRHVPSVNARVIAQDGTGSPTRAGALARRPDRRTRLAWTAANSPCA